MSKNSITFLGSKYKRNWRLWQTIKVIQVFHDIGKRWIFCVDFGCSYLHKDGSSLFCQKAHTLSNVPTFMFSLLQKTSGLIFVPNLFDNIKPVTYLWRKWTLRFKNWISEYSNRGLEKTQVPQILGISSFSVFNIGHHLTYYISIFNIFLRYWNISKFDIGQKTGVSKPVTEIHKTYYSNNLFEKTACVIKYFQR